MPIELKICGINSNNIIKTIVQNGGCQYLGFVFYPPSPRNLSIAESKKLTSIVPNHIKKVAVLVKPENGFVEKIKDQFDYLQVYETSPSKSKALKLISNKKIIQAIKVKKEAVVTVQNIVASINLGGRIHLEQAARTLPRSMYEPEQFPGLIHRMVEPKTVILLFSSGKLVCTGAKKEPDVYRSVNNLHALLEEKKLMQYE